MEHDHRYEVQVVWQGNRGTGTSAYRDYERTHEVTSGGKLHAIAGSADRTFHGEAERWNPEELLLAALSQCHMLSYLHCAVKAGVVVESYADTAVGTMRTVGDGGAFTEAVLRPVITISAGDLEAAGEAHRLAHELCFIANSVSFPVRVEPTITMRTRAEASAAS